MSQSPHCFLFRNGQHTIIMLCPWGIVTSIYRSVCSSLVPFLAVCLDKNKLYSFFLCRIMAPPVELRYYSCNTLKCKHFCGKDGAVDNTSEFEQEWQWRWIRSFFSFLPKVQSSMGRWKGCIKLTRRSFMRCMSILRTSPNWIRNSDNGSISTTVWNQTKPRD